MATILPPALHHQPATLTVLSTGKKKKMLSSPLSSTIHLLTNSPLYSYKWLLSSPQWDCETALHHPLDPITVLCTVTNGCFLPPSFHHPLAPLTVICTVTVGCCLHPCPPPYTCSSIVRCTVTSGCCLPHCPPPSTSSDYSPLYNYKWLLSCPLPSNLHLLC